MPKAVRGPRALAWPGLAAVVGVSCLLAVRLVTGRTAEATPGVITAVVEAPARAETRVTPAETEPQRPTNAPPPAPSTPIESSSPSDSANPRHFHAMLALARAREDAVDDCRDHLRLPHLEMLRAWATVVRLPDPYNTPVQEISLQQTIVFEISALRDAYRLISAHVVETWLEFPDANGSLLRAPISDAALDRCVESALTGAVAKSPGVVPGEMFRIQGAAGEAVYDLH